MSEFDFGDLGYGIAGGGNVPNLEGPLAGGGLSGFNFGGGGLNIPSLPDLSQAGGGGFQPSFSSGLNLGVQPLNTGTPAPDAGGGFDLKSILGGGQGLLKDVTGLAGVGLQGLGIKNQIDALHAAKQQTRQTGAMQEIQKKSAEPLQQFGTQQLQQASAGHIDPAAQAMIDQWLQAEKQKMQQFFASQGISNSTMLQSAMADLDSKAVAMRNSVLGQDKNTAIQALSQAMQGATAGAATASREQDALDNLIAQSNKALAQLAGAAA